MRELRYYLRKMVKYLVIISAALLLIQISGLAQHIRKSAKAFVMAAYDNNLPSMKIMANRGISVDSRYQGMTALIVASRSGHLQIVQYLLQHGAKINARATAGETALMYSVDDKQEHIQVVKELLKHQAYVNLEDYDAKYTALDYAVISRYHKSVGLLLIAGANPNLAHWDHSTTFIDAAHHGYIEGVRLLLPKVVNIDQSDQWDDTALNMSARGGFTSIVKLLVNSGANINRATKFSRDTPLIAASSSDLESVQLLVSRGANLNAQNKLGESPLIVAASSGKLSIVQFLFDKGSDCNLKDHKNRTALDLAKARNIKNKAQIISILEKAIQKKIISVP